MAKRSKQERDLIRQWHASRHMLDGHLINLSSANPQQPPADVEVALWQYHLRERLGDYPVTATDIPLPAPFRFMLNLRKHIGNRVVLNNGYVLFDAPVVGADSLEAMFVHPQAMQVYWALPDYVRDCRPECKMLQQTEDGNLSCIMSHHAHQMIAWCPALRNRFQDMEICQ